MCVPLGSFLLSGQSGLMRMRVVPCLPSFRKSFSECLRTVGTRSPQPASRMTSFLRLSRLSSRFTAASHAR